MRLNSTMAVMAIVCVAVVMGGELRLGPLAKLLLAARSDDQNRNPAMVAAAVVYDEPDVLNAYSLVGPPQLIERNHWTDAALEGGLPHLGSPIDADFGPDVSPTHNFLGGGFMALGTSGPGNPTTDQPPVTQPSNVNNGAFLSAPVSAPTPEPTTWVMMVLGVGGIGAALRRARVAGRRI
jgi:hypothetical protein